jgi:hypothetical protein
VATWMRWLIVAAWILLGCFAFGSANADSSSPQVKLSRSGICHEKGTEYYDQTKRFRSFGSVEDCLAAGGRLPKRSPQAIQDAAGDQPMAPGETQPLTNSDEGGVTGWQWTNILSICGILAIGGAVLAWWRRRRERAGFKGQAAAERRRWAGHRLSKADQADEQQLLTACMGNREQMERLIDFELGRDTGISRAEAIARAMDRWRRDRH